MISTVWNAGTLHFQYVGPKGIPASAVDTVGEAMWRFATECQLMVVLYAGVLFCRETMQARIGLSGNRDGSLAISTTDKYGNVSVIRAGVPKGTAFYAFSAGGELEATFAKSFVVSAYHA